MLIDKDKKVKLKVVGISQPKSYPPGIYLLILREEEKSTPKDILITIGSTEAQSISIALDNKLTERPLTHTLFCNVLNEFNLKLNEVQIYKLHNNIYYSLLLFGSGKKIRCIDSRTSDAVAMALRFDCPVFCDENILEQRGERIEDEENSVLLEKEYNDPKINLGQSKYDHLNINELKKELDKAVSKEAYEDAALIRDKILKKEK